MPITACFGVTFLEKIQFCMIARLFFTQNLLPLYPDFRKRRTK
jgi:hypothetical protein